MYLVIRSRNLSFSMRTARIASHIVIFSKQNKQRISMLARFSVRINMCATVYIYYIINCIKGLHWQLWKSKVLYLWKYNTSIYVSRYILPIIFNIILVHLILEILPKKKWIFSHQHQQKIPIISPGLLVLVSLFS